MPLGQNREFIFPCLARMPDKENSIGHASRASSLVLRKQLK